MLSFVYSVTLTKKGGRKNGYLDVHLGDVVLLATEDSPLFTEDSRTGFVITALGVEGSTCGFFFPIFYILK